ncbi:uncharacterized protein LOC591282 [Strongylocentrotus purpuratus]|uniref:Uncharacterized protein n=1 Tax=Strongylocentrotus purpuratus TaxID=7668 RepID=A0A7M7RHX4_STRPU|nr:uncharacterized protein LOC591282 [Strongylocentrotus purpuratus]
MADNTEIEGDTGGALEMQEPTSRPPPTIDDLEIPPPPPEEATPPTPPPEEDGPPPPPQDEDTPSQTDPNPPLTPGDAMILEAEPDPEAPDEPQDAGILDAPEVTDTGSAVIDHPPPNDCGSPLPPYNNDSGVDVPSTSTADVSELEGKDLQREFDEIQIEGTEDDIESSNGIHNASTLPSKRPMAEATTPNTNQHSKVTGYIEMSPEETKAEMKRVKTYRRESIMWVTIFFLIAGAIAVIFYFAYNITQLSDASLPDGEFRIRAVMILDYPWEEEFAISSSSEHMMLAYNITDGINSTYTDQSSAFKDVFLEVDMFSFSDENGIIRVSFQCLFSGTPSDDIGTRPAFSDLFIAELEDGFDNDNFYNLTLKDDEPVNVVRFTTS